jgi:hypothetical protein
VETGREAGGQLDRVAVVARRVTATRRFCRRSSVTYGRAPERTTNARARTAVVAMDRSGAAHSFSLFLMTHRSAPARYTRVLSRDFQPGGEIDVYQTLPLFRAPLRPAGDSFRHWVFLFGTHE